ncbi:MAG: hypothetical protein CMK07_16955 [Ponticaulis sp.]|nr:hypothetical protein [Ponticaulis sp.]
MISTNCQCWKLVAQSGQTVLATDHDRPVSFRGEIYQPGLKVSTSAFRRTLVLSPEPLDLAGALEADNLSAVDLADGVWDGARVTIWRVNWADPEESDWLWSGCLSSVETEGGRFRVGLASQKSDLEKTIGRIFGRRCDADFGDARCGVTIEGAPQASCDKRFSTCRDVFENAARFRGFPHMPGNDVVISGPGEKRDGSSRGIER